MQTAVLAIVPVIVWDLGEIGATLRADVEVTSAFHNGNLDDDVFRKCLLLFLCFNLLLRTFRQNRIRLLTLAWKLVHKGFRHQSKWHESFRFGNGGNE